MENALVPPNWQGCWSQKSVAKTPTVQTFIESKEKCAGIPSLERASKAINMQSRRPTEQCFYVLELAWVSLKGKKCKKMPKVLLRGFKSAKFDGKMSW